MKQYILTIDQGTTISWCIVFCERRKHREFSWLWIHNTLFKQRLAWACTPRYLRYCCQGLPPMPQRQRL